MQPQYELIRYCQKVFLLHEFSFGCNAFHSGRLYLNVKAL